MPDNLLTIPILVLIAAATAVYRNSRTSRVNELLFGTIIFGSLVLCLFQLLADHFSGHGFDEAVIFHLRYGLEGAGFSEYRKEIAAGVAALFFSGVLAFAAPTYRRRSQHKNDATTFAAYVVVLCSIAINPAIPGFFALTIPASEPAPQSTEIQSDFDHYYRTPTIEQISSETKNLVFIYAEGLERTYFDENIFPGLVDGLRRLEAQSTHFTDIRQVVSTGFTVGGIVASQCGLPLLASSGNNTMGGMDTFLPGAPGLGNLLNKEGYYLSYFGGAMSSFAGKGKFLSTHKFDEVRGLETLIYELDDRSYLSPWGIHDDTLFDLAFERYNELCRSGRKFGLFMLTLDTHHPNGHVSKTAENIVYGDGSNPMLNAVAAADYQISAFVDRIRNSPFSNNTVIVIVSDHLAIRNAATDLLGKGTRRNMFIILDPQKATPRKIDRLGSTLDIGPTILPTLGFRGSIGLGRDLTASDYSRPEIEFIQDRKNLLRWKPEITQFWDFPSITQQVTVSVSGKKVMLDDRAFDIPILVELDDKLHTSLNFPEQPDGADLALPARVGNMDKGKPYFLIDQAEHLGEFVGDVDRADWCLVAGMGRNPPRIIPLPNGRTFSRDELLLLTGLSEQNANPTAKSHTANGN